MKIVIQRVSRASVTIERRKRREMGPGLLLLIGVGPEDGSEDIEWLVRKIIPMRIFEDAQGKMNLSAGDIRGDIMAVSQFTLFASTKKGNRPSFHLSAPPAEAERLYESFCASLEKEWGKPVIRGEFGAYMEVELINDGPVTILIDSRDRF